MTKRAEDRRAEGVGGWCILRTTGGRTLPLAKSLSEGGFDVWTPSETKKRRKPRSKVVVEHDVPIMPTFVFARAAQLPDLVRCLAMPVSPHPPFSIFRHSGRIPVIAERDIQSLRAAEERAHLRAKRAERHSFPTGAKVKLTEGAFAGMTGVVESGDGKFAFVCFGGTFRMQIATFHLTADDLHGSQPVTGAAAQAA